MAAPRGPVGRASSFAGWGFSPWPRCHPQGAPFVGPLSEVSGKERKSPPRNSRNPDEHWTRPSRRVWAIKPGLVAGLLEDTDKLRFFSLGMTSGKFQLYIITSVYE